METLETTGWSQEEVELIQKNIDLKLDMIHGIFTANGYTRSKKAIERKKSKINKVVEKVEGPKIIITSTPTGSNSFYEEFTKTIEVKSIFETTLTVPDSHVFPGQDINRFVSLGKYANSKRPNNIVFMGDFGNFDSLSAWDAGKEASHGKQYKEDIKICREALLLFFQQLDKTYKPRVVFLGGNHDEGRIEKYIESHPQLRGHMDIAEDLRLEELGIEYVPYKKFLEIQGTLFTHAVMTAANTPVSGKSIMGTIASLTAKSIVVGHHHKFETMSYYRHGADDTQQVLLCGLFCEDTPDYADGAANAYNRCVCLLTHWAPGRFDIDQISLGRLKALHP